MNVQGIGVPADVQHSKAYTAALGFERMLLEQLTKPLAKDALSADDGSADSGSAVYGDLISTSLADSVSQQGGLGLANDLYRSFGT
jgi:Rod binding domain-containing protein